MTATLEDTVVEGSPREDDVDLETTRSTTVLRAALRKAQAIAAASAQADLAVALVEAQADTVRVGNERDAAVRRAERAERKISNLWAALEVQAQRRDWCSEYDDFARENDGPSRYVECNWKAKVQADIIVNAPGIAVPVLPDGLHVVDMNVVQVTRRITIEVEGTSYNIRRGVCGCDSYTAMRRAQQQLESAGIQTASGRSVGVLSSACQHCQPSSFA